MLQVPDFLPTANVKGYALGSDGAEILLDSAVRSPSPRYTYQRKTWPDNPTRTVYVGSDPVGSFNSHGCREPFS